MTSIPPYVRPALFIVFLSFCAAVSAQAPKNEPEAGRLLKEVAEAYKAAPSYADHGEFVLDVRIDGVVKTQRSPLRTAIRRPNKLSFDAGVARLVTDGKTLTTVVAPLKKSMTTEAPSALTFDSLFREGPVGSAVLGGPGGPTMRIFLNLLLSDDPLKAFAEFSDGVSTAPDAEFDGKTCKVVKVKLASGSALVWIDPETKLVRAIDVVFNTDGLADTLPKPLDVSIPTCRWTAGAVSTDPLNDKAFTVETPKDFSKLDASVKAAALVDAEPRYKVHDLIGKPAPAFTLTLLDGEGKTRTVTKADLAGKVVVIDFWATWCGPCLEELPQVQELIQGYARAGKGVVIVALSQDNMSPDLTEVRKAVEQTLAGQKIVLTGTPVGKVGLDPSLSVGEAFEVQGYPTVVVLDAKGVVRAAHVGFAPDIGKSLAREIDALLAGKPAVR